MVQVRQRYGRSGAANRRNKASLGYRYGLPHLQRSRASGASEANARLDALLAIMAVLSDTCVLGSGPAGWPPCRAPARYWVPGAVPPWAPPPACAGPATAATERLTGRRRPLACLFLDKAGSL